MRRSFVYKLKPTVAQALALGRYLDVTRDLYNAALEQRIDASLDSTIREDNTMI
ncbi:MAG TPA: helix-turn-helix domain-containing protein [Solirubrobacteraceae bacterium]|jgi:hypothetical protein